MTDDTKAGLGILGKMLEATRKAQGLQKTGVNQKFGYPYFKDADIAKGMAGIYNDVGLVMLPPVVTAVEDLQPVATRTGVMHRCRVFVTCSICDPDTGDIIKGDVIGSGADMLDKAEYKAMTGAVKYFLMKTHFIADHIEPEDDAVAWDAMTLGKEVGTDVLEESLRWKARQAIVFLGGITETSKMLPEYAKAIETDISAWPLDLVKKVVEKAREAQESRESSKGGKGIPRAKGRKRISDIRDKLEGQDNGRSADAGKDED